MRFHPYIILIAFFIAGCGASTATNSQEPTEIPILTSTSSFEQAPSMTATPAWQFPECDEISSSSDTIEPYKFIYTNENQVYTWDQSSQQPMQIPLPSDGVAPQVSADGRYVAYLVKGKSMDTPDKQLDSIPLFLFDRQNGESIEISTFSTVKIRKVYPDSPAIKLEIQWVPERNYLIVQVFPVPWGEGIPQPTGDLFLVNADNGEVQLLVEGGDYEYYNISPAGDQVAFMDTGYITDTGLNYENTARDGKITMVDIPSLNKEEFPIPLSNSPWSFAAPNYSPDSRYIVNQVESGLLIINLDSLSQSFVPVENPCKSNGCYWGGYIPLYWSPDSQSLVAVTSSNDYFDQRAKTTLNWISINSSEITRQITINANPSTIGFSPDHTYLTYWNQDDLDSAGKDPNHVSLNLLDLETGNVNNYATEYLLRLQGWSPNNSHFLYSYSRYGGPNPIPKLLALGSICNPPVGLFVPTRQVVDHIRWLDNHHFLAWTLPDDGIPDVYYSGLYLYSLDQGVDPVFIDSILQSSSDPYGMESQVLILKN
jgi:hypothetical protein